MTRSQPVSSEGQSALSVQGAGLSYAGRDIFSDVDLALEEGQWTVLLGQSGVGKSSLLKYMAGLDAPGAMLNGKVSRTSEVSYMAQKDLLLPWLTVLENVLIGPKLRQEKITSVYRDKALSLLDRVGLVDRAGDKPQNLSGGMRQRAALARTLMEDRDIVLMDEPFSALDALTRMRLQDEAAQLLSGKTVFLVTHDPMEALRLADRIIVLSGDPVRLKEFSDLPTGDRPRDPARPEMAGAIGALVNLLGIDEGGRA